MSYRFNPFTGTFDVVDVTTVPDPLVIDNLTVNTLLEANHIHGNLAGAIYIHVKNTDSTPLTKGTPFYITGTVGASDRVEIQAADAADPAKGPAIGLVEDTLGVNGEGNGVLLGEIFQYNTLGAGWSTNDALYVAGGGGLTNVEPSTGYRQIVGYAGRIDNQTGTIVVIGNSTDPVAGSNTEIQYNNNGGFGASSDLTWDDSAKELGVGGDINLDDGGTYETTVQVVTPTANRTISFPDATGTVALVAGSTGQVTYNNAGAQAGLTSANIGSTGEINISLAGAASTPPVSFTGSWFTGGTATTTKPQLLIEPTGTTSTAWSTSGTGLGVNAASGFAGRLLDLQTNGTSRMVVQGDGKLGLGTSSPASDLHVNGGVFTLGNNSVASTINAVGDVLNYDVDYDNTGGAGANHNWKIKGTSRMFLNSTGLGIGTSTPSTLLTLSEDQGTAITLRRNNSAAVADDLIGKIDFFNNDSSSPGARVTATVGAYAQSTAGGTYLTFSTATNGGSNAERLRIDQAGNVGIGTTSPGYVLETAGDIRINPPSGNAVFRFGRAGSNDWAIYNDYSDNLVFYSDAGGAERARIDSSGRLLVGTSTSPSSGNGAFAKAVVQGNTADSTTTGYFAIQRGESASTITANESIGFLMFNDNAGNEFARVSCVADADAGSGDYPGRLVFSTTADGASTPTERMTIKNDGNVIIPAVYSSTTATAANVNVNTDGYLIRSVSSIKYKTNVETLQDSYADSILNCRPVWYQSTSDYDNKEWGYWGFIAEEVAEIDPRLCLFAKNEDGGLEPEGVQYDRFVPHLLNLLKRQKEQIEAMEARLSALEAS